MNCPNAFGFLIVGLVTLTLRAVLGSTESISDVRAAWLLVMGAVFCLIATGYGLQVAARRLRGWIEARVRVGMALSRARADRDHGQLPAAGGVRISA